MRKLIEVAGLLAVIVAIFAVLVTQDTARVEAEGISVDENGELVLPQAGQTFLAFMNGAQEVDPVITDTTGLAVVLMNDDFSEASFALMVNKGQAVTAAGEPAPGISARITGAGSPIALYTRVREYSQLELASTSTSTNIALSCHKRIIFDI